MRSVRRRSRPRRPPMRASAMLRGRRSRPTRPPLGAVELGIADMPDHPADPLVGLIVSFIRDFERTASIVKASEGGLSSDDLMCLIEQRCLQRTGQPIIIDHGSVLEAVAALGIQREVIPGTSPALYWLALRPPGAEGAIGPRQDL